jgi:hypothetical protein
VTSWSSLSRNGEARKHARYRVQGSLRILWQDAEGRERVSNAQLVDVSVSGTRLRVEERIPERTSLICNDRKHGISGRGTVRYLHYVKGRYEIGVEFSGGTGWQEPAPEPAAAFGD